MIGPGKYDPLCTVVREEAKAQLVALIVFGGTHGEGFSCQATDPRLLAKLPDMLETMAKQIRADMKS